VNASAKEMTALSRSLEAMGISRTDADATVTGLVQNRALPAGRYGDVAQIGVNLSAATGKAPEEATKGLAAALTGGYETLKKFDDEWGVFSTSERASMREMAEHGEQAHMLDIAIAALHRRFDGLKDESLGPFDRALNSIRLTYNGLLDSLSKPLVMSATVNGWANPTAAAAALAGAKGGPGAAGLYNPADPRGVRSPAPRPTPIVDIFNGPADRNAAADMAAQTSDPATDRSLKLVADDAALAGKRMAANKLFGLQRAIALAEVAADEEIKNKGIVGDFATTTLRNTRKAEAAAQFEAGKRGREMRPGTEAAGDMGVAAAYLQNHSAGIVAEAQRKASLDALRLGFTGAAQAQDELNRVIGAALVVGAKHVSALDLEAASAAEMAAAARQGAAALREAKLKAATDKETEGPRAVMLTPGATPEAVALAQAEIDRIATAMRSTDTSKLKEALNAELAKLEADAAAAKEKAALTSEGLGSKELAGRVAQIDYKAKLQGMGLTGSDLSGAYAEGAPVVGKIAESSQQLKDYEEQLKAVKTAGADFTRVISSGFENAVFQGQGFKAVLGSVAQQMEQIALRMLVTKPMENMMSGLMSSVMPSMGGGAGGAGGAAGGLSALLSGAGGWLSGLFGGGGGIAAPGGFMPSAGMFGHAATGGMVDTGRLYSVNENSTAPGLFMPLASGRIDPSPAFSAPGGGPGGGPGGSGGDSAGGNTVIVNIHGGQGTSEGIRRSGYQAAGAVHQAITQAARRQS
jgi:hypothetical protein